MNDLALYEDRYDAVKDNISAKEQEKLERLRVGLYVGHYGHDLVTAVARGWRNKAIAAAHESMRCMGRASAYGGEPRDHISVDFAGALHSLVVAGAERGLTADQIRQWLQRELDCYDSGSIEKRVARAHKETGIISARKSP
jgi:hypothetical protein